MLYLGFFGLLNAWLSSPPSHLLWLSAMVGRWSRLQSVQHSAADWHVDSQCTEYYHQFHIRWSQRWNWKRSLMKLYIVLMTHSWSSLGLHNYPFMYTNLMINDEMQYFSDLTHRLCGYLNSRVILLLLSNNCKTLFFVWNKYLLCVSNTNRIVVFVRLQKNENTIQIIQVSHICGMKWMWDSALYYCECLFPPRCQILCFYKNKDFQKVQTFTAKYFRQSSKIISNINSSWPQLLFSVRQIIHAYE